MVFRKKRAKNRGGGKYPGFYVRFRVGDREVVRWAGPDRSTAHDFAASLHRSTAREDLLGERAVAAISAEDLKPAFLAYLEARHGEATVRGERGRVERIVRYFGKRPLREVGPGDVADFLTSLRAERHNQPEGKAPPVPSTGTKNRYASCLSVLFRFAVEKGAALSNPVKGLARPHEDKRAVPFLSTADVDRILAAESDATFRSFLRLLGDTGMRLGEALRLEWRDVDLSRGVLLVRRSKAHESREVPMIGTVRGVLEALRTERAAVPMTGPDPLWPAYAALGLGALSARFRRLAARSGFTLRLHDLRHGLASRLAQAGVPIPTIATILGHKCLVTTMRYAGHLPTDATAEAMRSLETPAKGANRGRKGVARGVAGKGTVATDAARVG